MRRIDEMNPCDSSRPICCWSQCVNKCFKAFICILSLTGCGTRLWLELGSIRAAARYSSALSVDLLYVRQSLSNSLRNLTMEKNCQDRHISGGWTLFFYRMILWNLSVPRPKNDFKWETIFKWAAEKHLFNPCGTSLFVDNSIQSQWP